MSNIIHYGSFGEFGRSGANHGLWQRFLSIAATAVVFAAMAFAIAGCHSSSDTTAALPTVAAAGAPTNLTVAATASGTLSATLTWSPPTTGGAPASYEIYRSTAAGTAYQAANHLISIPVSSGSTYSFIDNAGLSSGTTYYWAISAKNAGGETPTAEVSFKPTGTSPAGFGNNFSSALIFADDIGITGLSITGTWTLPTTPPTLPTIDYNTGLRPLSTEAITALPYLDPATAYIQGGTTYYKQQTASTWQGEWAKGASTQQNVIAKWGDNLVSQSLSANSVIRIEMVLSKALTTPMTSYTMKSLYGTNANEIQGTDGTTYANSTAFVYATNARLTIQKMDVATNPVLLSQPLWKGDGPGYLAGEINVSGNFTYGFVWNLKSQVLPSTITSKSGTWRLTFSLDPNNSAAVAAAAALVPAVTVPNANNNTYIDSAANGSYASANEVYIDITVK
jgi:hypothetical protein